VRAQLQAFDDAVDDLVDRIRSPQLDGIVYRLSSAADHSLLWNAAATVRAVVGDGDLGYVARFAAAMGIESAITNGAVKSLFGRLRPADYADIEFRHGLRKPITSSFPSGHATAGFCAATLLGGGGWYVAAACVAATRVYVRLHHASDVAAGAALGLALGAAMKRFVVR
jgi:undecaprenyl-diphosphatase